MKKHNQYERWGLPAPHGLYHPAQEHDACGVGFVCNLNGEKTHAIVEQGVEVLINLTHRGAAGCDPETGDGAGLLFQVPDEFFREAADLDFQLPQPGQYAVGMVFLPTERFAQRECMKILEDEAVSRSCPVLGWRPVPVDMEALGWMARSNCPAIMQVFLQSPGLDGLDLERRLYVIRRRVEKHVAASTTQGVEQFHVASLSSRTLNYKGLMLAPQLVSFYPDLASPAMKSALCVVHQRYSTNTFPSWPLAQPFRLLGHNGEINTLRGNISNMRARYATLASPLFGKDLKHLLPVIVEGGSDSACFDNMLELLVLGGRSLPHALMMMVPEAWGDKYYMGNDRRAFYEYHAMFMEPWDGPAALVATDGVQVAATLDRNGLRPARYVVTKDGLMVLASEVGVLDIPSSEVAQKGRLSPGRLLVADTERKRLLSDEEAKAFFCRQKPYRRWVSANRVLLRGLFSGAGPVQVDRDSLLSRQRCFGYSREDVEVLIRPMCQEGKEPVGSMGDDTPLAVLSDEPRPLFDYFKQLFAQVTNPAIDPIREDLVMSLTTYLGKQGNLLDEKPEHARMLKLNTPILSNDDLHYIRDAGVDDFKNATLDMTWEAPEGPDGMLPALERLCAEAEDEVRNGCTVIILSDRQAGPGRVPIPSLLAAAAVNHHLVRKGLRTSVSCLIESGEPREVMHFALLLGYGATAINPYLVFESIASFKEEGSLPEGMPLAKALENYIHAIEKGLLKIFSKMGISTLRSYRGAQIFEALGLDQDFVDAFFSPTPTRIGGVDAGDIARDALTRQARALETHEAEPQLLESGGKYAYRLRGERHLWTPQAISSLQQGVRSGRKDQYEAFAQLINEQETKHCTLRSLLRFKEAAKPLPLKKVEPAESIVRRFVTGAMSFGSISREAHQTMAIAMNRLGSRSNSGEGGEDRARYQPLPNGDSLVSQTKQVASGRFGVTTEYLVNASELQIKVAQGAKPGEGGQLPGDKVNDEIAKVRHSTPGVSLISPPPHHDIYSIEDLAQLIFDLKNVNPKARINVKLVSEVGVGTVAAGVSKGHADAVLISGGDGGTGASPLSSIKHAGIPWELGLSETHQVLVANDLRTRIKVQTDGQMRTGRDVAIAALLGAEEFGFGTIALVTLGCVMLRKCHTNTCPAGVATQDPRCRKRFQGRPEHLINYFFFVAEELRQIMSRLGFSTVDEMVGRADMLEMRNDIDHAKAAKLDFSRMLTRAQPTRGDAVHCVLEQDHGLESILDREMIEKCGPALDDKKPVQLSLPVRNINRTVGAMLSGEIALRHGHEGLPDDTIALNFQGSAGQSFGAFGMKGVTFMLEGDSNDYVGKGLSGAKIIVRPPEDSVFDPKENVVVGNVALYGATSGEAYFSGLAGERFAIRNSGALAVVEGTGDHCCEYMTGGVVVVLGRTGVNFAAGMSGGIAFVYDPHQDFDLRCNLDMVDIEAVSDPDDVASLKQLMENHLHYTGSARARALLQKWEETVSLMVKVMPMEYRRALGKMAQDDLGARRTEAEQVRQA